MEIQLSLIVWTVICFVLLSIILNKMLFKPVISVIDKRKKRIENANVIETLIAQEKNRCEQLYAARLDEAKKRAESEEALEEDAARGSASAKLREEQAARTEAIAEFNRKTELEESEYRDALLIGAAKLATDFVASITAQTDK